MNHAPPGDWHPPEPSWMQVFRDIEASITRQVNRYIAVRKRDFLLWFCGGLSGYWTGFLTVELVKWWAGIK